MSSSDATNDEDEADRTFQLYIDEGGEIGRARGACAEWLGLGADSTTGRNLAGFLAEESHFALSDILCSAIMRETLKRTVLWVRNKETGTIRGFDVTGGPQSFNDFYRLVLQPNPKLAHGPGARNSRAGFVKAVSNTLRAAEASRRDLGMTFVDLGDVSRLNAAKAVDEDAMRAFTDRVEDHLRRHSVDDTVGRVRPGRYGLVHEQGADLDGLHGAIEGEARDLDPRGDALSVRSSTVALSHDGLDEAEIDSALDHAVGEFEEAGLDAIIFDTLDASQAAYIERSRSRLETLRQALEGDTIVCAYRRVVHAEDLEQAHLHAEPRVVLAEDELGAAEILRLTAEDQDLRRAVDHAACRKLLTDPALEGLTIALDVAIRSMLDRDLIGMLLDYSRKMGRRKLILRLSGLAEVEIERVGALETLRRAGFQVALHGNEIGAVTESRLDQLPVDYILLDPSYGADVETLRHSVPSLNAMANRCLKHRVGVIVEGIVEGEAARLLTRMRGALLSGPYFGAARDHADTDATPP
ncbi:EAL domain-containing protein [Marivibrio halodurans]|uniref:EAL domain-containing protein n=1 Tax=Marivibrio halodurans TaxID=2039722 RepID=A0A8J7V0S3_9PROT|nr:EAL domain-containing protein [Marivibrio halodurans]MBP5855600.1 EAL domain-containing protein [Marivibrio halodurans]